MLSWIAQRIYAGSAKNKSGSLLATIGMSVALVVMLLSVFVATGFKREITDKVFTLGGHLQVLSRTLGSDGTAAPVTLDDSLRSLLASQPVIRTVTPIAAKQGMLKTETDFTGMQLRGMDNPQQILPITEGQWTAADTAAPRLIISDAMARQLNVGVGDTIFAYFINGNKIKARRFAIAARYATHLSEYDNNVCFTNLRTVQRLNNWLPNQYSILQIQLRQTDQTDPILNTLAPVVNTQPDSLGAFRGLFSAQQLTPHIFSWLELLDSNVWLILLLMTIISAFTTISGILMIMLEKISTAATLQALGASHRQVRVIFQRMALRIIGKALLIGNAIALLLYAIQRWLKPIRLDAQTYYIDRVPVAIHLPSYLLVNLAMAFIALLVVLLATHLMAIQSPAKTLRSL